MFGLTSSLKRWQSIPKYAGASLSRMSLGNNAKLFL